MMLTLNDVNQQLVWMASKVVSIATNFLLTVLVNISAKEDNLSTSAIHITSLYYGLVYRLTRKSLLEAAIEEGKVDAVKLLVDLGEPINQLNHQGKTPLHLAASSGQAEIVACLLDKGADYTSLTTLPIKAEHGEGTIVSSYNQTPLHLAIQNGNEATVKCFINHLNKQSSQSPVNDDDLKLPSKLDIKNSQRLTPLSLARRLSNDRIEKLLQEDKQAKKDDQQDEEKVPLEDFTVITEKSCLTSNELLSLESIPEEDYTDEQVIEDLSQKTLPLTSQKPRTKELFQRLLSLNLSRKSGENMSYPLDSRENTPTSPDGPPKGFQMKRKVSFVTEYFEKIESRRESLYRTDSGRCSTPEANTFSDRNGNVFPSLDWDSCKSIEPISIHEAAATGIIEAIAVILSQGVQVDMIDTDGNTPLHLAARYGQLEAVKLLLDKGASIKSKNSEERTALHVACFSGDVETIRQLILRGVDIESKDVEKNTALHIAASLGHLRIVQVLTDSGALVNVKNGRKQTPVHKAAFNGFAEVVDHLITKGASINPPDSEKDTPLHLAAHKGHLETVRIILDYGGQVDVKNKLKRKPIHEAAYNGSLGVMSLLLEQKTDLNSKDKNGDTALNLAAAQGHTQIVELLIEKGARVNPKKDKATSPLHMAALNDHLDTLMALIQRGANVALRNKNNDTPLHLACSQGNAKIVQILLNHGSPVDVKGSEGRTPLHVAVINGHTKIPAMLVEKGADMKIKDSDGRTALHYAKTRGNFEAIKILEG